VLKCYIEQKIMNRLKNLLILMICSFSIYIVVKYHIVNTDITTMLNILMVPMESNGSSITELDAVGAEVTNQALNNLENVEVSVEVDTAENDS